MDINKSAYEISSAEVREILKRHGIEPSHNIRTLDTDTYRQPDRNRKHLDPLIAIALMAFAAGAVGIAILVATMWR
jgi:hypothetical protein